MWSDEELLALFGLRYARFRVLKHQGKSGMVQAICRETGQNVIIKTTPACDTATQLTFLELTERISSHFPNGHPNLVSIRELGTHPSGYFNYLIMEQVIGKDLFRYSMENANLTVGGLITLLNGVASGIDALHSVRLVHRDIKPENIIVEVDPLRACIVDFDISIGVEQMEESGAHDAYGTPAYMAPEQIIGANFGPSVDIYSFAMTIYTILTRKLPYEASSPRELIYAQVNSNPIPLCAHNRNWPAKLQKVIAKSLSKKPAERHPSAQALMDDISEALKAYTPFRLSTYFEGRFSSGEVPINF